MFIENASAVDITMSSVETQAAIFKSRFGVKEHDKVYGNHCVDVNHWV